MKNKPQIPPKIFWDDDRWAHENYQTLLKNYPNKWVAVLNKKVICARQDLKTVKSFLSRKLKTRITPLFHIEGASHIYKEEDEDILEAYGRGVFKSVPNVKNEISRYREYAKSALRKNKRINIRLAEIDIVHIQRKAVENGLPYQTLISSVLHKYADGNLVEKNA